MVCAKCNKEFEGGYSLEGLDICDECGRKYTLAELESLKKKNEDATQASMVDGGRISVFGSKSDNDLNDFYKELFELKDFKEINEDDFKVISNITEDTGGHTMVIFGELANHNYFQFNEELLVLYDDDCHKAYLELEDEDYDTWKDEHMLDYYDSDESEYKIIAKQLRN